jgi:DNA-binding CsgD family transcriptional regulator
MALSKGRLLSKGDLLHLLELIQASLSCATEADLKNLVTNLKCLFPHDFASCVLLQRTHDLIDTSHSVNISYPAEWCEFYVLHGLDKIDPVIQEMNKTGRRTQVWADAYKRYDTRIVREFVSTARDFGLKEGYSHGARTPSGNRRYLFNFAGSSLRDHRRMEFILENIGPHLGQAFSRVVNSGKEKGTVPQSSLSSREIEVLNWIKDGKSTWEISSILLISTNTVQFHVKNIMEKLDVVNRSQAVAVALDAGLIGL